MAAAGEGNGGDTIPVRGGTVLSGAADPVRADSGRTDAGRSAMPPAGEDAAVPAPPESLPESRQKSLRESPRESSPRRSGFAAALALIAIAGVLAVGAAFYLGWRHFEATVAEHDAAIDSLDASVRRAHSEIATLSARVASNTSQLTGYVESETSQQAAIDTLTHSLEQTRQALSEELRALAGAPPPAFAVVDVERLLIIANDALALQRDPDIALAALHSADRRLRATDDPRYAETRRLLGIEIASLEGAARPDIAGMAYLLGGLQVQLRHLAPDAGPAATRFAAAAAPTDAVAAQPAWRDFLGGVWQSLRSLVVIRRSGADEAPLLAPEQQQLVAQNLYLKLESARAALLGGDEANFRLSLRDAGVWLTTYYPVETPAVAALLEQLETLQSVDIKPQLPDISASLMALRAVGAAR